MLLCLSSAATPPPPPPPIFILVAAAGCLPEFPHPTFIVDPRLLFSSSSSPEGTLLFASLFLSISHYSRVALVLLEFQCCPIFLCTIGPLAFDTSPASAFACVLVSCVQCVALVAVATTAVSCKILIPTLEVQTPLVHQQFLVSAH